MGSDFGGNQMTIPGIVTPQEVHALIVGIETYNLGKDWDLDGPANDAINFANWLLDRGVKSENIHLFLSPKNADLLNNYPLNRQTATRENISNTITHLISIEGKLLYVFWGGHGIITKSQSTTRRLLFSDTDYQNYRNLDLNSLQEAFKTSNANSGFAKQVFLIDACANSLYEQHFDITRTEQAGERFGANGEQEKHLQFVLFAVSEYNFALSEKGKGGFFSQAVMEVLNELPKNHLLPDMDQLDQRVKKKLEETGKPQPVYKRFWNGDEEYFPISLKGIDWHEVSRKSLAEQDQQKLSTNFLTAVEGVNFQVKDVYVPLGLVERKKQSKRQDDAPPEKGSELYKETEIDISENEPETLIQQDADINCRRCLITKTFQHNLFLEEVIKQHNTPKSQGKRIAIIGEPGAGKTTLLQQIASWILSEIEQSILIWVSLADLQGRKLEDYIFETWLTAAVRREGRAEATSELKDKFAHQFRQSQVWLLLDGLDEMPVDNPLNDIDRQIREGGSISQARIILTCRVNLWDNSSNRLSDFDIYRTLNFSYPDQVEEFIKKWFSNSHEAGREKGQKLCKALKEQGKERIQDLVKNPLRLALLCLNRLSKKSELPDTKTELYQQFVDDFYKWKQTQFPTTDKQRQTINQKLGELAKQAINEESARFRLREDLVNKIFNDESLLKLAKSLGWLNQVGIDDNRKPFYAFFHASFQEYFAATAISDYDFFLPSEPTLSILTNSTLCDFPKEVRLKLHKEGLCYLPYLMHL